MKKAIGIEYKKETERAPHVIAKGQGFIAEQIIEIAKKNKIPIYEDPDLVEVLSTVDLYSEIPPVAYKAIAEILAFIYTMNEKFKHEV